MLILADDITLAKAEALSGAIEIHDGHTYVDGVKLTEILLEEVKR